MTRVRTTIEIDRELVEAIMERFGARTMTEAVELALRHLADQPMTREEAMPMRGRGAIGEIPVDVPPFSAG
jgi:Arc/MetJ family transcription regulator